MTPDALRARLLPLRRPPLIAVAEGRFVPISAGLDEIDAAWRRVQQHTPRAFDGPMLHVAGISRNGHGGVTIHCLEASYRFHAVARDGLDTGIRPLGVKGICRAADGRVLMALRSAATLNYAGQWEFSPGGTVEPGAKPAEVLLRELQEETGWRATSAPIARALAFDPVVRSWEIVFTLDVAEPAVQVEAWETREVRLVTPGDWPQPLSACARTLATALVNRI